jgi:hypothetical protein
LFSVFSPSFVFGAGWTKNIALGTCKILFRLVPGNKDMGNYFKDVQRTRGRRIISVPDRYPTNPSPATPFFRTPDLQRTKLGQVIQYPIMALTQNWVGGPYEFAPVRAVEEATWGQFTQHEFGVRERPSMPVRFIAYLALSFAGWTGWNAVDAGFDKADSMRKDSYIESHKPFFDFILDNDYRSRGIKEEYLAAKITLPQARQEIQDLLRTPYSNWFHVRDAYLSDPAQALKSGAIDKFALFEPIQSFLAQGIKPEPGFDVPPSAVGPISDAQLKDLFNQIDDLAIKQEFITRLVHSPYNLEDAVDPKDPKIFTQERQDEIMNDPFNKQLFSLHDEKKISLGDLIYGLQDNESWKINFEHYKTLGITPLTSKTSKTPLTLEMVQNHIMKEVLRRAQWHRT